MNVSEIQAYSELNGCSIAQSAIMNKQEHLAAKGDFWHDIDHVDEFTAERLYNICDHDHFLCEVANEVALQFQFPRNSIFLHSLGVVASAMCKGFNIVYRGAPSPVTMYVVTGQPPSTGKSGINNFYTAPIHMAYEEINKRNKVKRMTKEKELFRLKQELKAKEKQNISNAIEAILQDISDVEEELKEFPIYTYSVSDATVESLEAIACRQQGMFNVISAESDSVNILLGGVYNADKKANLGVPLSAWDGEYFSSERISRDAYKGYLKGCIAVMAQNESINTLLEVGAGGRGISERVLIMKEANLLGIRDHRRNHFIDYDVKQQYADLVKNIVNESGVDLKVTKQSWSMIIDYREQVEPDLKDGGKYGNNLLRGFVGKADKHILKIASVLHVANEWSNTGSRNPVIDDQMVLKAISIFKTLVEAYANTASELGYLGKHSEMDKVIEVLQRYADRRRLKLSFKMLKDAIKHTPTFKTNDNLMGLLKEKIIPELERRNYVFVWKRCIYINPNI